jgi:hypothetical protein
MFTLSTGVMKPPTAVTKVFHWVRLVLIYNYVGIWFDCDVMFLHSPEQIIKRFGEFVTQWEKQEYTNNCFMHFIQKGPVITALLKAAVRSKQSSGVSGLRELRLPTLLSGITIIPNMLTEFCWVGVGCDVGSIFAPYHSLRPKWLALFATCVIWHWQNRYDHLIDNSSLFTQFEQHVDSALAVTRIPTII